MISCGGTLRIQGRFVNGTVSREALRIQGYFVNGTVSREAASYSRALYEGNRFMYPLTS